MRNLLLFIVLLSGSISLHAQELPIDPETGKIVYQEVVDVPGASADELFHKANYWLNTYFPTIQNQVEMIDSVNHEVVCKRFLQAEARYWAAYIPVDLKLLVMFTVKIESKAARYRYTFTDFKVADQSGAECGWLRDDKPKDCQKGKWWKRLKEDVNVRMGEMINAMKSSIKTEEDDW